MATVDSFHRSYKGRRCVPELSSCTITVHLRSDLLMRCNNQRHTKMSLVQKKSNQYIIDVSVDSVAVKVVDYP